MRSNVDLLKTIQVGLTFADEEGNFPLDICTWQFNFHFDVQFVAPFSITSICFTDRDTERTCTHPNPSNFYALMG